jgi:hypothetical protein
MAAGTFYGRTYTYLELDGWKYGLIDNVINRERLPEEATCEPIRTGRGAADPLVCSIPAAREAAASASCRGGTCPCVLDFAHGRCYDRRAVSTLPRADSRAQT